VTVSSHDALAGARLSRSIRLGLQGVSHVQTIVITGSSRGIGFGLAKALLERGCQVVISGRNVSALDKALKALSAHGAKVTGIACDVSKTADAEALWAGAVAKFGKVDVWINNAGTVTPRLRLDQVDEADIDTVVATNLMGVIKTTKVVMKHMLTQGGGCIYNFEGFGSDGMSSPGLTLYGATKRAVTYFTKSMVKELADTPVRIGTISPGIVATDLLQSEMKDSSEAERAKSMKLYNILGDRVETVAPFIADGVLKSYPTGAPIRWLTMPKAMGRFMTAGFNKRDIFSPA
jgi:NAD(P)-dependent dehydrogenase (short-subunit alcohol dehydrogenase family)